MFLLLHRRDVANYLRKVEVRDSEAACVLGLCVQLLLLAGRPRHHQHVSRYRLDRKRLRHRRHLQLRPKQQPRQGRSGRADSPTGATGESVQDPGGAAAGGADRGGEREAHRRGHHHSRRGRQEGESECQPRVQGRGGALRCNHATSDCYRAIDVDCASAAEFQQRQQHGAVCRRLFAGVQHTGHQSVAGRRYATVHG